MRRRVLAADLVYLVIAGGGGFFFTVAFTLSALYRIREAGLSPLQLILLGTALEGSVLLFEVPTGVVADIFSRRLSVIIGYTLIGAGITLEGAIPRFETILIAQLLWGIGLYLHQRGRDRLAGRRGRRRAGRTALPAILPARSDRRGDRHRGQRRPGECPPRPADAGCRAAVRGAGRVHGSRDAGARVSPVAPGRAHHLADRTPHRPGGPAEPCAVTASWGRSS